MVVERKGDWLSAQVGDEVVMMSAGRGHYIGLNAVGARIWELLDSPRSIETICARLIEEFNVAPDVCRAEVEAFLGELKQQGAVTLEGAAAV
jgi:hypothetical protein